MKLASIFMSALVALTFACSDAPSEDAFDGSEDALGTAPSDADPYTFEAPQIAAKTHVWDTVVMQNESGFDGVVVMGRTSPDAEPDQVAFFDRRTGAVSYMVSEDSSQDPTAIADELQSVGEALSSANGAEGVGTRDFVTPENVCFVQFGSIAVIAIAAVFAAPYVVSGVEALGDYASQIADQGLRAVVKELAKKAWASKRFKMLLALKVVKDGAKAWLLFSNKGKQLTAPLRRQVKEVVHAKCFAPPSQDPDPAPATGP